ncbi:Crp/Fnr family transcriptional regulator [Sneathiella limimaris]|uniref:Crp/Fnr family transcriptional regulator n=1 Tax=Sneathiella limimaris TaxID=1964213 RepID=UPI00146ACA29|nr:helix-turn-helix domain-containing protein [Sneathiella limimaris]
MAIGITSEETLDSQLGGCRFNQDANKSKVSYCASCSAHKYALCSKLDGEALAAFGANSTHRKIDAGQTLYSEYDEATSFYTVVSGEVRLSRMLDDGRRQITGFKSQGDFLGLSTKGLYTADAEAIDDVVVCQFSLAGLNKSLENFSAVQVRLMEMMQAEVIDLQDQMLLLGRKTPIEKIANFLLDRAERHIERNGLAEDVNEVEFHLPMSRVDIADFLGLTIETVSRTFTKLKKSGLIELKTSQDVKICDLDELRVQANSDE